MKNLIIGMSVLIMIGLIIAIVVYQKPDEPVRTPTDILQEQVAQNKQNKQQTEEPLYAYHMIDYSLQNDKLNITFDKGDSWVTVPVELANLFDNYRGNEQELVENSYILNENRAAFLYEQGPEWNNKDITLVYSLDQGKTWQHSVIAEHHSTMRFRKVAFLNDQFGYCIISGDKTMSQELSHVYLTHDGGVSWEKTHDLGVTRLISDGGFTDEKTGFISIGGINPSEPILFVTNDAGNTWNKAKFDVPEKYSKIFVLAETPMKEGDHLTVLVNQGPNGDYLGGKVKGKFISTDNGATWEFSMEVEPNETEEAY